MILAVDPGLDATGWATFAKAQRGGVLEQLAGLLDYGVVRTKPKTGLPERLNQLAAGIALQARHCDTVLIEKPLPPSIVFKQRRQRQRSRGTTINADAMQTLSFAVGAITASCRQHGAEVILVPTRGWRPKKERHALLARILQDAKRGDLLKIKSPDVKDALWLGITYLGNLPS